MNGLVDGNRVLSFCLGVSVWKSRRFTMGFLAIILRACHIDYSEVRVGGNSGVMLDC